MDSSAELPDMAIVPQIGPRKLLIDPAATQEAAMAPGKGAGENAALRSSEEEDRTRGTELGGGDACAGGGILERTEMLSERKTAGEAEVTVGVEALASAEMHSEAGATRESGVPVQIRTLEREEGCSETRAMRGRELSMGEGSMKDVEACSEVGHVVSPREETLEGKQACSKTGDGGNSAIELPEVSPISGRRANQEECSNLVNFSTLSLEQVSALSSEQALVVSAVDASQGDIHQKICSRGGAETVETSRASGFTSHDDRGVVGSKVTIKCNGNEQEEHIGSFELIKNISEQVDNYSTRQRTTSIAVDASLVDVHMAGDGKEIEEERATTPVAPENYEVCRSSGKGTEECVLISQSRSDASQSGIHMDLCTNAGERTKEIRTAQPILKDDLDNTVERKAELEVLSEKVGLGSKIEALLTDIRFVDGERPIIHQSLLQKEGMVVEKACGANLNEVSKLEEETMNRRKNEKMDGGVFERPTNENQLEVQVETPSNAVLSVETGEPYGSVVLSLREAAEKIQAIGSQLLDESLSVKPELKTDSRAEQLDREPLIKEIAENGEKQKEIGHVNAVSCAESSPSKSLPEEGRIHEVGNQINTSILVKNGKEIERVDIVNSTFSVHAAVKSRDSVTSKDFLKVKGEESGLASAQQFGESTMMHVKTVNDVNVGEGLMSGSFKIHKRYGDGVFVDGVERGVALEEMKMGLSSEGNRETSEEGIYARAKPEKSEKSEKTNQKRKASENDVSDSGGTVNGQSQAETSVKKAKKKTVNVWAKSSSSRKGGKKNTKNGVQPSVAKEDAVFLTPVFVNQDKVEDGPDQPICLSRTDKAEKIELSENRLSASSTKGYRMVRATRGVQEGTWYFEILVEQLGPTGHTRLGWSTQNGDVQAPVGFDSNSYGYRDVDGSKVHVAVREPYGDRYVEGDVIGFYIHLPNGTEFAPEPTSSVSYRGRPYHSESKDDHPKKVPGSEICFFRNGVCQGTAFKDINGGRYFPAASMYTMPKEPNCTVKFNFGPHFQYPPHDRGTRPFPMAMCLAPYHNDMDGKETTVAPIMNDPSSTPSIQRRGSHIYGSI